MQYLENNTLGCISNLLNSKKPLESELEIAQLIRTGLPFRTLETICLELDLSQKEVLSILGLNPRTLLRRKTQKKMHKEEGDRIYRLVRIYALALLVLEDKNAALHWLQTPKIALNGEIPLQLLDTNAGAREVEQFLGRIEYGIGS
ncbi:MAG: antitoxin Xre/MbcA/ParS toxin-binding domain-containing protein [Gammaproteobacteria bacterium]